MIFFLLLLQHQPSHPVHRHIADLHLPIVNVFIYCLNEIPFLLFRSTDTHLLLGVKNFHSTDNPTSTNPETWFNTHNKNIVIIHFSHSVLFSLLFKKKIFFEAYKITGRWWHMVSGRGEFMKSYKMKIKMLQIVKKISK